MAGEGWGVDDLDLGFFEFECAELGLVCCEWVRGDFCVEVC